MARTKDWQRYLDDPEYGIEISESEKRVLSGSVSLQETVLDEEQLTQIYPTLVMEDPLDQLDRKNVAETLDKILERLDPWDRKILKMRFLLGIKGPFDYQDHPTLVELGELFEVSRTTIRNRENGALLALRHPNSIMVLRKLIDKLVQSRRSLQLSDLKKSTEDIINSMIQDRYCWDIASVTRSELMELQSEMISWFQMLGLEERITAAKLIFRRRLEGKNFYY